MSLWFRWRLALLGLVVVAACAFLFNISSLLRDVAETLVLNLALWLLAITAVGGVLCCTTLGMLLRRSRQGVETPVEARVDLAVATLLTGVFVTMVYGHGYGPLRELFNNINASLLPGTQIMMVLSKPFGQILPLLLAVGLGASQPWRSDRDAEWHGRYLRAIQAVALVLMCLLFIAVVGTASTYLDIENVLGLLR